MSEGKHFDEGKPRLELLPRQPLIDIARVLEFGATKYDEHNWCLGMPWLKLAGSVLRHFFAWLWGEDNDSESGLPHLAHAACDILFLLEYRHSCPELDNRYKPVVASMVIPSDASTIAANRRAP